MTLTTERQQFEEWFNKEMVLRVSESDETVVRLMWKAWQASRELLADREAPPAPAVPECFLNAVAALEYLYRNGQKQNWNERYTADMAYSSGVLNACRAAMLGGEK